MQNNKSPFLLFTDSRCPDTQFICEYGGEIRVKVSKADHVELSKVRSGSMYGLGENAIYVFESACSYVLDDNILIACVNWYKRLANMPDLRVLEGYLRIR